VLLDGKLIGSFVCYDPVTNAGAHFHETDYNGFIKPEVFEFWKHQHGDKWPNTDDNITGLWRRSVPTVVDSLLQKSAVDSMDRISRVISLLSEVIFLRNAVHNDCGHAAVVESLRECKRKILKSLYKKLLIDPLSDLTPSSNLYPERHEIVLPQSVGGVDLLVGADVTIESVVPEIDSESSSLVLRAFIVHDGRRVEGLATHTVFSKFDLEWSSYNEDNWLITVPRLEQSPSLLRLDGEIKMWDSFKNNGFIKLISSRDQGVKLDCGRGPGRGGRGGRGRARQAGARRDRGRLRGDP
jgi:hypothetical protein